MMYTAAVRRAGGAWQMRQSGASARDAKRKLAKVAGLPVRVVDKLGMGRSKLADGGKWAEVVVESR